MQCSNPKYSSDCHTPLKIQKTQQFPKTGLLAKNMNFRLSKLAGLIRKIRNKTYSYVVRTVKLKLNTLGFEQHGSAPNFQGDVLTLCTCKHQMRSRMSADDWEGVWIAGFTSRAIHDGRHWLFYLAKVESAYDSHSDLWMHLDTATRNAKAAHVHFLGDIFKPKTPHPIGNARFSPSRYVMPYVHAHRQDRSDTGWQNDINYHLASKSDHPPLLVADPKRTFLWDEPMIFFTEEEGGHAKNHCRDYLKWSSLQDLCKHLQEPS